MGHLTAAFARNTMSPAFAFSLAALAYTPPAYYFIDRASTCSTFGRPFFLESFSPAFSPAFSSSFCHNFPSARDLSDWPAPGEAFGRSFCLVNIAQIRSDYFHFSKPQTYGLGLPRRLRLRFFFDFRRFVLSRFRRLIALPRLPRTFLPLLIRQPAGGPLTR